MIHGTLAYWGDGVLCWEGRRHPLIPTHQDSRAGCDQGIPTPWDVTGHLKHIKPPFFPCSLFLPAQELQNLTPGLNSTNLWPWVFLLLFLGVSTCEAQVLHPPSLPLGSWGLGTIGYGCQCSGKSNDGHCRGSTYDVPGVYIYSLTWPSQPAHEGSPLSPRAEEEVPADFCPLQAPEM